MSNHNDHKIPILSFYSGGGFLDMGFEMAGFEIVWTNEVDGMFAKLHSEGITSWRKARGNGIKAEIFNTKSIVEVNANDIVAEAFPNGMPEDFGIIGGPPCQDFSVQGNMNGFNGERGKLTIVYFDRILSLKPTFFVMENVTGLTKSPSTKAHLAKLLKRVEQEYYVDHETLNALDFGVPQHRERVFFVGILKSKIGEPLFNLRNNGKWFDWPENIKYRNAETKYLWPEAVAFGKSLTKPKDLPLELCIESCLVSYRESNKIANANEYFNLYISEKKLLSIGEGETNRPSFKRLHRFRYSPTACYGNNEVHLHPYKHRRLSVREALRIQGVPDTYVLPEGLSLTKKFKMIGNGVPVPLAEAIATALYKFIEENRIIPKAGQNGHLV
ncbi:DNA cytosine methyltransferase [Chitinophaga sp. LS1]|uniref:DNA cytosine methyltransferase n=1 Tax=Chitinophaga sp. LS1 TaxID=3051176 RepID=UPI002AAB23A3|nr:DNA cytosine methyltransferase [Chitinophaga sp. LS1]WPV65412.1 DNA cytosine methyltransferase [Chitinophaga sp. LS1]